MEENNKLEFIPCAEGLTAVVTKPDGEVGMQHMTWEQFMSLRKALGIQEPEEK